MDKDELSCYRVEYEQFSLRLGYYTRGSVVKDKTGEVERKWDFLAFGALILIYLFFGLYALISVSGIFYYAYIFLDFAI
ncbi:hypothetical protein [Cohnella soli]|uniref:Uncharacterized protein n=1 Tax=Cohnella soli TaxID=425005 RepID=A0ABW0HR94_9BACL